MPHGSFTATFAAVFAAVLSGLEEVASSLEVSMSDALNLVTQQPTLLLAKVSSKAVPVAAQPYRCSNPCQQSATLQCGGQHDQQIAFTPSVRCGMRSS